MVDIDAIHFRDKIIKPSKEVKLILDLKQMLKESDCPDSGCKDGILPKPHWMKPNETNNCQWCLDRKKLLRKK